MSNNIALNIKVTHSCNLKCLYCYDAEEKKSKEIVSIERAKKFVRLASKYYDGIDVLFHGGEPLVVPIEFYEEMYEYCKTLNLKKFTFGIQTNSTLLTEEKLKRLYAMGIRPSVSYDGTATSIYRCDRKMVEDKIALLDTSVQEKGVICTASKEVLDNIIDEYENFKNLGLNVVKINWVTGSNYENDPYVDLYINKMNELFDYWVKDPNPINIDKFRDILNLVSGNYLSGITSYRCEKSWIGMDNDGLLGMCDFGNYPRSVNFGNIDNTEDIGDILFSERRMGLIKEVSQRKKKCFEEQCPLAVVCTGGCNAHIYKEHGTLSERNTVFCKIIVELHNHIKEYMRNYNGDSPNKYINEIYKKILNVS